MIKYREPQCGIIMILEVYYDGEVVGRGFHVNTREISFRPILSDENGEPLPEQWYCLKVLASHFTMVSLRIQ